VGAVAASPVEGDLVGLDSETRGKDRALWERDRAIRQIKDLIADPAVKVVMVTQVRELIAQLVIRQRHRGDFAPLKEQLQGSIDGCDAKVPELRLSGCVKLLDGQWTPRSREGFRDSFPLGGSPLSYLLLGCHNHTLLKHRGSTEDAASRSLDRS